MLPNVKFFYEYRDESNYKNFGSVIFTNPDGIPIDDIKARLQKVFFASMLFNSNQVGLPELFFEDFPLPSDMTLHEFDSIETTDEVTNDYLCRTINQFIKEAEKESATGWTVIDPLEELFRQR